MREMIDSYKELLLGLLLMLGVIFVVGILGPVVIVVGAIEAVVNAARNRRLPFDLGGGVKGKDE